MKDFTLYGSEYVHNRFPIIIAPEETGYGVFILSMDNQRIRVIAFGPESDGRKGKPTLTLGGAHARAEKLVRLWEQRGQPEDVQSEEAPPVAEPESEDTEEDSEVAGLVFEAQLIYDRLMPKQKKNFRNTVRKLRRDGELSDGRVAFLEGLGFSREMLAAVAATLTEEQLQEVA